MEKSTYTFGEENIDRKTGYKTWKSPEYEKEREIAISLLESDKYKEILSESDFWIQKRPVSKEGGCFVNYEGLALCHNAFLKINETLSEEKKFDEKYVEGPISYDFGEEKGYYLIYRDPRDGMMEVGEISSRNVESAYPFAILFKRIFDRVVKRKAEIYGIYSDSEDIIPADFSGEFPKEMEKTEKPKNISLSKALDSFIEDSKNWAGHRVSEILSHDKFTLDNKRKILSNLSLKSSSESDRLVCSTVLKALENGELAVS